MEESKVDLEKEKSLSKSGSRSQSKLVMPKFVEKSMPDNKLKSKSEMQKNTGKTKNMSVVNETEESTTLIDNMNFICPMCKLVRFCNITCLKLNVDRPNCHPCSKFLKVIYFTRPVGAESE